jgi:hypothetical protein
MIPLHRSRCDAATTTFKESFRVSLVSADAGGHNESHGSFSFRIFSVEGPLLSRGRAARGLRAVEPALFAHLLCLRARIEGVATGRERGEVEARSEMFSKNRKRGHPAETTVTIASPKSSCPNTRHFGRQFGYTEPKMRPKRGKGQVTPEEFDRFQEATK